jgi:hypothetical protein
MMTQKIKHAAALSGVGLAIQVVAALHWTPATFIVSAALGVPLVLAGSVLFMSAIWRNLKDKGAA